MFSKILAFSLLFTSSIAGAVNIPQASSVVFGGGGSSTSISPMVSTPFANIDTSGFVNICGGVNASTSGDYVGLYGHNSPVDNTQYKVPSGKTFYMIQLNLLYAGANACYQLGYGTATLASADTATSPTGSVLFSGNSASVCNGAFTTAAANIPVAYSILGGSFPALSYPYFRVTGISTAQACIMGVVK